MKMAMAVKKYFESDQHAPGAKVELSEIKPFLTDPRKAEYAAELSEYLGVEVGGA